MPSKIGTSGHKTKLRKNAMKQKNVTTLYITVSRSRAS